MRIYECVLDFPLCVGWHKRNTLLSLLMQKTEICFMSGRWGATGRIAARILEAWRTSMWHRSYYPCHKHYQEVCPWATWDVFFADFQISPQVLSMLYGPHLHIPHPQSKANYWCMPPVTLKLSFYRLLTTIPRKPAQQQNWKHANRWVFCTSLGKASKQEAVCIWPGFAGLRESTQS